MPSRHAFTLIELSILLVIIGLLAGGVLVGRELIAAAAVRSQLSQIEDYQSAIHTFRGKYNYLPGDLPNAEALRFGFAARGTTRGRGDGNGILEDDYLLSGAGSLPSLSGELLMFWWDLSHAKMIDGRFTSGSYSANPASNVSGSALARYIPSAILGQNATISVWSGGWPLVTGNGSGGKHYLQLGEHVHYGGGTMMDVYPAVTVRQAYLMDSKMDDGYPQWGKVTAMMPLGAWGTAWAGNSDAGVVGFASSVVSQAPVPHNGSDTAQATANDNRCYDNGGVAGAKASYSISWKDGRMMNCTLAFEF